MKGTKIRERFENAFEAFFDDKLDENNNLITPDYLVSHQSDKEIDFWEKHKILINILKQFFLFFPATFILFIISFAFTTISINNPFNATLPEGRMFWIILWFIIAIFMTWFGLGDARKPKHLVIPVAIITTGIMVGAISGIISLVSHQFERLIFSDAYPLYFFPLALIAPFLAKGLIDRNGAIKAKGKKYKGYASLKINLSN